MTPDGYSPIDVSKLDLDHLDPKQLEGLSHADIYALRDRAGEKHPSQDMLAALEHQAYAREATKDNPLMALSLAFATPAYGLSKALGITPGWGKDVLGEIMGGYKGIAQGLGLK